VFKGPEVHEVFTRAKQVIVNLVLVALLTIDAPPNIKYPSKHSSVFDGVRHVQGLVKNLWYI